MMTSCSTIANSPITTPGPITASGCTRAVGAICEEGSTGIRLRRPLEQPRRALSSADAHRHHTVTRFTPRHLVGDRPHHPRARHSERMPDSDRPAVHVQNLPRNAQPVAAIDHLDYERLVRLP